MTKTSSKLKNLDLHSRCEQIYHTLGVEGQSGGKAVQDATSPVAYGQSCGYEGLKILGNLPRDGRRHAAEPRVHGREDIRHPAGGKPAK